MASLEVGSRSSEDCSHTDPERGMNMAKGLRKPVRHSRPPAAAAGGFPETDPGILAEAAAGDFARFFDEYLAPCWREVVIVCRQRGIAIDDADDVLQELSIRIIQSGRFGGAARQAMPRQPNGGEFRGNLPARFLKYRELPLKSARFRTYLKQVINHLVLEKARDRRRRAAVSLDSSSCQIEPWMEESLSRSLDARWLADCLTAAACELRDECRRAATRGQRRLFDVLYRATVGNESPGKIGRDYGVDRTTISGLLTQARERLLALLSQATGVGDRKELMQLVAASPEVISQSLLAARAEPGYQIREK